MIGRDRRARTGAMLVITLTLAAPAAAQVPNIGLSLFSPGARANAMGRAFIGVADDASAAITNPAGLVNLTRRQIYAEFKSTDFEGLFIGTEPQRVNRLSFVSVSLPVGQRAAVAATRHEFLNFDEGGDTVHGDSYAGSIARGFNDRFSAGVTVSLDYFYSTFDESAMRLGLTGGGLWRASDRVTVGFVGAIGKKYIDLKRVPARAGAGVGIQPTSRFLLAADVLWVDASDPDLGSEDVVEVHMGAEYLVKAGTNQVFVRAGGYVTPKAGNPGDEEFFRDAPVRAATIGAGFTIGTRVQIDAAYLSSKELVVSSAIRF
jgi:hypothetical protein